MAGRPKEQRRAGRRRVRARVRAGSSGSCGLQAQLPTSSATAAGRPGQVRSRARKSGRAGDPAIPRLFPFQSGGAFNIVLNSCKGWCQRTVRSDTRFLGEVEAARPRVQSAKWACRSIGLAGARGKSIHAPACMETWAMDTAGKQGLLPSTP